MKQRLINQMLLISNYNSVEYNKKNWLKFDLYSLIKVLFLLTLTSE